MTKWIAKRLLLYAVVLVAPCMGNAAGVRQPAYADLYHTPWAINDGTPPDIWAIDQSPNGFLIDPAPAWADLKAHRMLFTHDGFLIVAAGGKLLRTTSLRIDFTAAGLTIPSRVRFRFKLEGVDTDWTDAGDRREVFYANLGPGSYRFHVIAANEDGIWNTEGAALKFTIAPTFFQTRTFLVACVLAIVLLIWTLYLWRLRLVGERVRERVEERHRERDRIARELHDTLLQGFQGSIYRVQAAAERISADAPARIAIETALDLADQALANGRHRVAGLRADADGGEDLPAAFARIGNDFALEFSPTLRVLIEGTPRTLQFIVGDDIHQIGREAIVNAFRHARASTIEVEIIYGNDDFRVRIRDDGCGIDPVIISAGGRPGHWGLAGMRERACSIGAVFNIWAGESAGTEMEVRLPAARAYVNVKKSIWRRALRSLVEWPRAREHYPS